MTKARKKFQPLTSKNICNIYELLHEEKLISFPLTQESTNKIESLVANINSSYFGQEIYGSHEEKVVAYLYFIIKSHAFTDGNKRVACFSFAIVCDLNDLYPKYRGFSLDELAVFLEGSEEKDYQKLIKTVAQSLFFENI